MPKIKSTYPKSSEELRVEWDLLAEERHRQIVSGDDISFDNVLVPLILRLLDGVDTGKVLDIGCGTGELTNQIGGISNEVIGFEPSSASVAIARVTCARRDNVQFVNDTLESALPNIDTDSVSCATAAMTLMTTPDIDSFANALAEALRKGTRFVATLTHPCFWPSYWGYDSAEWYNYSRESFIQAPFTISKMSTDLVSTHIHRPLESYLNAFAREGFFLEQLEEPMPPPHVQDLYPSAWEYPRFIGVRWRKSK